MFRRKSSSNDLDQTASGRWKRASQSGRSSQDVRSEDVQRLAAQLAAVTAELDTLRAFDAKVAEKDRRKRDKQEMREHAESKSAPIAWLLVLGWIAISSYYSYRLFAKFVSDRANPATSISVQDPQPPNGVEFPTIVLCNEGLGIQGQSKITFEKFAFLFQADYLNAVAAGRQSSSASAGADGAPVVVQPNVQLAALQETLSKFDQCDQDLLADGYCDDATNTPGCAWDGGDCCASTNGGNVKKKYCATCACADPDASNEAFIDEGLNDFDFDLDGLGDDFSALDGDDENGCVYDFIGDGYCDDAQNRVECGFDNGDVRIDLLVLLMVVVLASRFLMFL